MTNKQYLVDLNGQFYFYRVPGDKTEEIIDRDREIKVYEKISGLGFCDDPIYIKDGYLVTKYLDCKTCNPHNWDEVNSCLDKIKTLHVAELVVPYHFNVFKKIEEYEKLMGKSRHEDYEEVKKKVFSYQSYINMTMKNWVLCHIDSVHDNFLITSEGVQLIDWEYAAMCDPDIDVVMFGIYAGYDKKDFDKLIDLYGCDDRKRIYYYAEICGLLWSNWCEVMGINNEYSEKQYEYARGLLWK